MSRQRVSWQNKISSESVVNESKAGPHFSLEFVLPYLLAIDRSPPTLFFFLMRITLLAFPSNKRSFAVKFAHMGEGGWVGVFKICINSNILALYISFVMLPEFVRRAQKDDVLRFFFFFFCKKRLLNMYE